MIYLILIVFLGSLVNSTFGFGFALVSMPLLSIQFGLNTLGPLLPLLFLLGGGTIVFRARKNIEFKNVFPLILAAILLIPFGVYLGKNGPESIIKTVLGCFIILFSIYNLSHFQLPQLKNNRWAIPFGAISGLFAGAYNISGPPAVIYGTLRQWSSKTFRASLQAYFLCINTLVIGNHIYMDSYKNALIVPYFLCACPAMLMAVPIGKKINNKIADPKVFNKYVYILMLLSGLLLIGKVYL